MKTIRSSMLSGWADCQRRSIASYYSKEIEELGFELKKDHFNNIGAAVGSAVHKACEVANIKKRDFGIISSEYQDAAIEEFRKIIIDGVHYDTTSDNKNTSEKQIIRMSDSYVDNVASKILIEETEKRIIIDLKGNFEGFSLSGQVDATTKNELRDQKTGSKYTAHPLQLGAYSLLLGNSGNEKEKIIVDFIKREKINKEQTAPEMYFYDKKIIENAAKYTIKEIVNKIKLFEEKQDENIFNANTSSMFCSPKFCSAYGTEFCKISKTKNS